MDAQVPPGVVLIRLESHPDSWRGTLWRAIVDVWRDAPPPDRPYLRELGILAEYAQTLLANPDPQISPVDVAAPPGSQEDRPLSVTLMLYREGRRSKPIARLIAILINAALEAGQTDVSSRKRIKGLSGIIRGAMKDLESEFCTILAEPRSLPELIERLDLACAQEPHIKRNFFSLWELWLRNTLIRWMIPRETDRPHREWPEALALGPDASMVSLAGAEVADVDDEILLTNLLEPEIPAGVIEPALRVRNRLTEATHLVRGTVGDIFVSSDQWLPSELAASILQSCISGARSALAMGSVSDAEPLLALAFFGATGTREADLAGFVWGQASAKPSNPLLDPHWPQIYRPVLRPPKAIDPDGSITEILGPSTEAIAWPIPPTVHRLLRQLYPNEASVDGRPVFPRLANREIATPYRLRDLIEEVAPDARIGALPIRFALVSHIARRLGPEVAQLALGDSFGISPAPAYYAATPESTLAAVVGEVQQAWFGEAGQLDPRRGERYFGTRLVTNRDSAALWPERHRQALKSAVNRKPKELVTWLAHRDHLAAALCAGTGHRLSDAIGQIDIHQVIPEFGLIVLRDKQVDVLRNTRIAATGRRWIADLRAFLDRLIELSTGVAGEAAAALAERVLTGNAPLFTVVNAQGAECRLTAADLRATMPEVLRPVGNHYRHRLNQWLQARQVPPELRHAQMGWVVGPVHAHADLSHWSACSVAEQIGPLIDDLLLEDGWYPATQVLKLWTWIGVPDPPMPDWQERVRQHEADHAATVRALTTAIREREREVSVRLWPRMRDAFSLFTSELQVNLDTKRLELRNPGAKGEHRVIEVTEGHHRLICERVRAQGNEAEQTIDEIVCRILLSRLIRGGRRSGVVKGPIPWRPFLTATSEPSPFLPTLGLAVRHAFALRNAIVARAELGRVRDEPMLCLMAVLSDSPYRTHELAHAAVASCTQGVRPRNQPTHFVVPVRLEGGTRTLVLTGIPALRLARRALRHPTGIPPTTAQTIAWLREISPVIPEDLSDDIAMARVVALFQAAGRVELSGPERACLFGLIEPMNPDPERVLARIDDWPVRTLSAEQMLDASDPSPTVELAAESADPPHAQGDARRLYRDFLAALDSKRLPIITGKKSDRTTGWRQSLDRTLVKLLEKAGATSNLGLLVGFSLHRLRYGGERRRYLKHASLRSEVSRFGRDFLAFAGNMSVYSASQEEIGDLFVSVLRSKPTSARRQCFDALLLFQRYLIEVHHLPEFDPGELAALAGTRVRNVDPGVLTPQEIHAVGQQLREDLRVEASDAYAAPESMRLAELRLLMFLVLEASGVRPDSAYGLTLADVHMLGEYRDFVHVRETGGLGMAKSSASRGFIPLDGTVWREARDWVGSLLSRERRLLPLGKRPDEIPLFAAESGGMRRFARDHLTRRIDELMKWATRERRARTYWLRKARITARHEDCAQRTFPLANDVQVALRVSGHVTMATPLENYVGNPMVPVRRSLEAASRLERADFLRETDLASSLICAAWNRAGAKSGVPRLQVTLDRMGVQLLGKPDASTHPVPRVRGLRKITPRAVDRYARAMHQYRDQREAMIRSGLSQVQASRLDEIALDLFDTCGNTAWVPIGTGIKSGVMRPARTRKELQRLFAMLDETPDDALTTLANAWAASAYVHQTHSGHTIVKLRTAVQIQAAEQLIRRSGAPLRITLKDEMRLLDAQPPNGRRKSLVPTIRWLLSILWIHHQWLSESNEHPRPTILSGTKSLLG